MSTRRPKMPSRLPIPRGYSRRIILPRSSPRSFRPLSSAASQPRPPFFRRRVAYGLLGLSLSIPAGFYFFSSEPVLQPHIYSNQRLVSTQAVTPTHRLITVPVPPSSQQFFETPYTLDGTLADAAAGQVVIQHVMIKSPDIQIERPYTLINDATHDKEMRMVVKRVNGGEVGRVVHSAKEGDNLGIRGPIPTFSFDPAQYDKIIMISTGTAISPFLQLLSKLSPSSSPNLELIHALPPASPSQRAGPAPAFAHDVDWDWANTPADKAFLPGQTEKFTGKLTVARFPQGSVPKTLVEKALEGVQKEKVLVLVCLPPWLMRPLCGGMTPNLGQGPVLGLLKDLGLTSKQVYKLE